MNKVTNDLILEKIKNVEFVFKDLEEGPRMTLCFITLQNGFLVTGESSCVDTENFVSEIGQTISYGQAFEKIWLLEGYLLKEKLYQEGK